MLVAAAVIFSTASFAQGVSLGFKAGINVSNQRVTFPEGSVSGEVRIGFHVGGLVTAMFSDQLGFQAELLFNSVGVKTQYGRGPDISDILNYLSVPVVFRYQFAEVLNIHAGPQVGFLLEANAGDMNTKDRYKGLDFGAAIGAGVGLPSGLGFSARYVMGIANVGETGSDEIKLTNNAFQISACYRFGGAN